MTDYTDPLGKWVEENISRFTEKIAVDNRSFPIIDSLAMLRAYVGEVVQPQIDEIIHEARQASLALDNEKWRCERAIKRAETAEAELAEASNDVENWRAACRHLAGPGATQYGGLPDEAGVQLLKIMSELAEARRDSVRLDYLEANSRGTIMRDQIDAATAEAQPKGKP